MMQQRFFENMESQQIEMLSNFLQANRLPASALGAGTQFGRAVHARAYIVGGGRSGRRSAP
jgi:hypothetical protein